MLLAVLIGLTAILIGLELVTRHLLYPRSRDIVRFASYPARATELCQQSGLRIAFVGNSATQCGVHPEKFVAGLPNPHRQPIHVEMFLADGSAINTWHYMVKQSFWRPRQNPDWIIVNYFDTGLQDGNFLEIGRLAQFFTTADDWDELRELDLPDVSHRIEYLLATQWATFAARDRIKKRVLNVMVPDYKDFAEELNHAQHQQDKARAAKTPAAVTHRTLERFLASAVEHRTKVIFVAFPTEPSDAGKLYALHPDAEKLIRDAGMHSIDLRSVPGLLREHYEDDIHLTPAGALLYTRRLVEAVAPLVAADVMAVQLAATAPKGP